MLAKKKQVFFLDGNNSWLIQSENRFLIKKLKKLYFDFERVELL